MKVVTNAKMASLDHDEEILGTVWAYVTRAVSLCSDHFEQVEQRTIIDHVPVDVRTDRARLIARQVRTDERLSTKLVL